jgi:polyphosphate kinase
LRASEQHAEAGQEARIIIKLNSLVEPRVVHALYAASCAGVRIDLIVRGMCCLRPGVPGISENIRVRSVIGRFLEHTRVMYFHNAGDPDVYLSSADWMERNFFRRVEVAFPIENPELRERVISDLETYLADDSQAWLLDAEGGYHRAEAEGDTPLTSQEILLHRFAERA